MAGLSAAYVSVPSAFGESFILWRYGHEGPQVVRIILPTEAEASGEILRGEIFRTIQGSPRVIATLCARVSDFLGGKPVVFSLDLLDFSVCGDFQRRVLLAEFQVPRGRVTTYGHLARKIGSPGAARAVGGALANNPFPLIIPCHRAIRADGHLGGYRGGLPMKRVLLEMEGVIVDQRNRVPGRFLWSQG